jgi:anti-anti-sigma factor
MAETEKKDQALLEKTNPVFNTAKTTLFQMAHSGNPYAAAIMEKMGLTEDTQKSKSFSMPPEEEMTFRIVLETRYQTMGKLARESGFPVIVDLPCGYTPRAIETAEDGREYIGMDLPAVISDMSGIIPSLLDGQKQERVRFCAVDATNFQSMEEALRDVKGNLCISTEGLLMYFSDAEIHPFLDNIKKLLDTHGGCWITADPEIKPEHDRIRKAIGSDDAEQETRLLLQEKADVNDLQNAMMVRIGHEAEDIRRVQTVLSDHGLKAERIRIAGGIAETKAFSQLSPDQGKAVLKATEDVAFWKVVSAGATGDREETEHSFAVYDELAGDVLELRVTGRVDSLTAPQLLEVYEKREAAGGIRKVRVDCHTLDYISSAGLRVLLIMQKQHGVKLVAVNSVVKEILETTGFDSILEMEE